MEMGKDLVVDSRIGEMIGFIPGGGDALELAHSLFSLGSTEEMFNASAELPIIMHYGPQIINEATFKSFWGESYNQFIPEN